MSGPGGKASGSSSAGKPAKAATVTAPNTSQLRKNVTTKQRKYVARNAPPGVDAEAILQSGEDACRRMRIAQASAGQASVSVAVITGQIANGREAINYLCPVLKPALVAADNGFLDGTYVVAGQAKKGRQVKPGRYTAPQASDACTWSVTAADGSVAADGRGSQGATVTLKRSQQITSTGCIAWLPSA